MGGGGINARPLKVSLRAYCRSRYKLVYTDVFIVLIALLSFEATRCCLSSIRHDGA